MPRVVPNNEINEMISLMLEKDEVGNFKYGQRELAQITGRSRPFIRKLARSINHQFPRNGIEIKGLLCMCCNCGGFFHRPKSKVIRAQKVFCNDDCKFAYFQGSLHGSWKDGKSSSTFSSWVKNQKEYKQWREDVLKRDNYTCVISGTTTDLEAHHILPKSEQFNPEKAFDIDNGITVCNDVHKRIHQLIREGHGFEESIDVIRQEYKTKEVSDEKTMVD